MSARPALVAVLLAAALTLGGCGSGEMSAEIQGYRPGPSGTQITVLYGARPGDGAAEGEVLDQDPVRVRVRVRYERSGDPQDDVLQTKDVVVTLDEPLGDRKVVDEAGAEVARQS